jgi:redox-sensitive bicupin YhaK (pirin superfamily)
MIEIRPANERGRTALHWLDSRHTFSFGEYRDAEHMGFRALRVINDDLVGPGGGFGAHPHRDMEILTWVLAGALEHRDSLGNGSVIRPGRIQRMTAGTGIVHSEYNPSDEEAVRLLQIWLFPERRGLEPGYEERAFADEELRGRLRLVASRDGRGGSVSLRQDADMYAARLAPGESATHALRPGRGAWVQIAQGEAELNGRRLGEGDGAAVTDEPELRLTALTPAHVLLFDLA